MEAAQRAIASPLLEAGAIDGARGILINITGSASLKLAEVQQACTIIQSAAHDDANIIFGAVMDEKMKDAVKITVIATGFRTAPSARHRQQETRTSFAARNDDALDFPSREPLDEPAPERIMSSRMSQSDVSAGAGDDRAFEDRAFDDSSFASGTGALAHALPYGTIPMDPAPNPAANFERDDLDVPAFLRKRSEVM
jgi:cell division protein FtsZ